MHWAQHFRLLCLASCCPRTRIFRHAFEHIACAGNRSRLLSVLFVRLPFLKVQKPKYALVWRRFLEFHVLLRFVSAHVHFLGIIECLGCAVLLK
jgi:hypothetical protein